MSSPSAISQLAGVRHATVTQRSQALRGVRRSTDAKQSSFDRGRITFISACAQRKGLRAQKQKKASTGSRTPYLPAKSAWPFPLHHDTLHVHPSLKMQLYNPLTIVPSSGPLSLWPSHSFWDPNLIKKCPPVPTILLVARQTPRPGGELFVPRERQPHSGFIQPLPPLYFFVFPLVYLFSGPPWVALGDPSGRVLAAWA